MRPGRARHRRAWLTVGLLSLAACGPDDVVVGRDAPPGEPRLLATAVQDGPVAFRDPVGVVSPDGLWLAYTEHRRIVLLPLGGGDARVLGDGEREPRDLVWLLDSSAFIARERTYDRSDETWFRYEVPGGARSVWLEGFEIPIQPQEGDTLLRELRPNTLADVAFVQGVEGGLGIQRRAEGDVLWGWRDDFNQADHYARGGRLQYPLRIPPNDGLACLQSEGGAAPRLALPCGQPRSSRPLANVDVAYGPFAFSPRGDAVYYGAPNERGVLELWMRAPEGGEPVRLASAERDAYAPSVTADGRVVYKTQEYRVRLATAPADGGPATPLTTFQSETPTWSPDGRQVAFTFGDWRRAADDFRYPDISQHLGMVDVDGAPHAEPTRVFRQSDSEDQGLSWSPDGRFVAFHSHADGSDDIYIQRADGSGDAVRVSPDGNETGWPRWSRNGRWIVYPSYAVTESGGRRSALFVIEVDPRSGQPRGAPTRVPLQDFDADALQAEWLDAGDALVFEAATAFGSKTLYRVLRTGGVPTPLHTFETDQVHSGIAVSPDGRWVAFVAPDSAGWYQIQRVPTAGGPAEPLTTDASHKTQPAYAPGGD
ncbi:MAG: PD40 domain-containing protein, partial [Gemmatimonadetes bacterium]|nr:PD40 domain-containing protein [Gemmatimonadota bacterium]